jgi:hypothetical protein
MKRKTTISFDSCKDCPFVDTTEGFSNFSYVCTRFDLTSTKIYNKFDEADKDLDNWFNNLCDLEAE